MFRRTAAAAAAGTALVLGALVLPASPAMADDRVCRGTIGSVSIGDNVVVPRGADCVLNGTKVDGNVIVKGGASVLIKNGARIDGNVQAENSAPVKVRGSKVFGDVQADDGRRVVVRGTVVDGNIQLTDNSRAMTVIGNLGGNMEDQCRNF